MMILGTSPSVWAKSVPWNALLFTSSTLIPARKLRPSIFSSSNGNKTQSKSIIERKSSKELKLSKEKEILYEEYKKTKSEAAEIDIIKSNVDSLLGASHRQSRDISAFLE